MPCSTCYLPRLGIKSVSPVLADGFSTTEPPGRSPVNFLTKYFFHCICIRVGRKLENIDKQKQHKEYSHLCHPDVTTTNTLVFIISDLFIYIYIYFCCCCCCCCCCYYMVHTFFFFPFVVPCSLQDLSSPTRDWTQALDSESPESKLLDCQGIPDAFFFNQPFNLKWTSLICMSIYIYFRAYTVFR